MRLLLAVVPVVLAVHSVPEDIHAFPRYSVRFLNSLPLDNHTAQQWLASGLRGGLDEFLGHSRNSIDAADDLGQETSHESLQFMRMGPNHAYLCFIPPPPPTPPPFDEDSQQIVPAIQTWQQLSALAGTCLYHRQGWFTYSYCHNLHVRQFRELAHSQANAVGQVPEEDTEWEAFTLGRSPTADTGKDLIATDEIARAQNLEVARGARQRYLVQRWGDGTMCDKTGRSREIEVQFHCSTTTTDTIMFVKEMSTCAYSLVIHTPRLCGEPGYKSRVEQTEDAPIRCREIVNDLEESDRSIPDANYPQWRKIRPTLLDSKGPEKVETAKGASDKKASVKGAQTEEMNAILTKMIQRLAAENGNEEYGTFVMMDEDGGSQRFWIGEGNEELLTQITDSIARSSASEEGTADEKDEDRDRQHEEL